MKINLAISQNKKLNRPYTMFYFSTVKNIIRHSVARRFSNLTCHTRYVIRDLDIEKIPEKYRSRVSKELMWNEVEIDPTTYSKLAQLEGIEEFPTADMAPPKPLESYQKAELISQVQSIWRNREKSPQDMSQEELLAHLEVVKDRAANPLEKKTKTRIIEILRDLLKEEPSKIVLERTPISDDEYDDEEDEDGDEDEDEEL